MALQRKETTPSKVCMDSEMREIVDILCNKTAKHTKQWE